MRRRKQAGKKGKQSNVRVTIKQKDIMNKRQGRKDASRQAGEQAGRVNGSEKVEGGKE